MPLSEVVLASACHALELTIKAYLLNRGRTDEWNKENIRHDLAAGFREVAIFLISISLHWVLADARFLKRGRWNQGARRTLCGLPSEENP